MAAFNTSSHRDNVSLRLKAQNMRTAKEQTKKLELENRKMEERLKELKMAMSREKEEREKNGGGFWQTGQSGNLSTYATDVLDKTNRTSAKDSKKKSVRVLKDEPLDLPSRRSEPGTMKYIAKSSRRAGKDNRLKGPKCGQCEDRASCLTCVQCSEQYCSGCFAAFHLRGALKKHRSIPLQASGPRQCMSPRPTEPTSYREPIEQSPAVGAVSSSISYQESERNGPEGASGSFESPSLLHGRYNEAESAASFQAALQAWRNGDDPIMTQSPYKSFSPRKSAVVMDTCTTMTDKPASPQIKFSHTISYADRLLLKQHRRTDPGGLDTHRSYEDYPSPSSSKMVDKHGKRMKDDTLDMSEENRVHFSALYQASVANTFEDVTDVTRPASSLSIVELSESLPKSHHIEYSNKYQVEEVDSFEAWELQSIRKSSLGSKSTVCMDCKPKTPISRSLRSKSCHQVTVENAVNDFPSDQLTPVKHIAVESGGKPCSKEEERCVSDFDTVRDASTEDQQVQWMKSRPASRKSYQSAQPKSGRQSRPHSRAFSKATVRQGEGVLTKVPSSALHDIASRLTETDTHLYSPKLQDFFMVGVKPPPHERTITPSSKRNCSIIKVSNRLYQMAPRSWRPDSSLSDAVCVDQAPDEDRETVISFTYSKQSWTNTDTPVSLSGEDNCSRSGTPQRGDSSPTSNGSKKSHHRSSHPSKTQLGRQFQSGSSRKEGINCSIKAGISSTQEEEEELGRSSRVIVMDGDDLTQYDDMPTNCNEEDEEALYQLEWELASESGRLTGDGQLSRLSLMDSLSDSGDSSQNSTPVIKLSMDKGFDINMKLRDNELCDDMDENASQMKDKQDVKALH